MEKCAELIRDAERLYYESPIQNRDKALNKLIIGFWTGVRYLMRQQRIREGRCLADNLAKVVKNKAIYENINTLDLEDTFKRAEMFLEEFKDDISYTCK